MLTFLQSSLIQRCHFALLQCPNAITGHFARKESKATCLWRLHATRSAPCCVSKMMVGVTVFEQEDRHLSIIPAHAFFLTSFEQYRPASHLNLNLLFQSTNFSRKQCKQIFMNSSCKNLNHS